MKENEHSMYYFEKVSEISLNYQNKKDILILDNTSQDVFKIFNCLPHPCAVCYLDDGAIIHANPKWQNQFGINHSFFDMIGKNDLQNFQNELIACVNLNNVFLKEIELIIESRIYNWFSLQVQIAKIASDSRMIIVMTATNIHHRKSTYLNQIAQFSAYKNMLDVSADCIKLLDKNGWILYVNMSGRKILGISDEGMTNWLDLVPIEYLGECKKALNLAASGKNAFAKMETMDTDGIHFWHIHFTPIVDQYNQTQSILCISRDITRQIKTVQKLERQNEFDPLTGLYNRKAFRQVVDKMLNEAKEQFSSIGLILMDLDYFKHVNETMGHEAGDHLLKVVAKRLSLELGKTAIIGRLGGDQFVAVISNVHDEKEVLGFAEIALRQLDTPVRYNNKQISGAMSIGCAMYPKDADNTSGLFRCVDTALSDLKQNGRGGVRTYNSSMLIRSEQKARQLNKARQVLRRNLITPYYQPKVNLFSQKIVGFEALLRWVCPTKGLRFPGVVAEAFNDYHLSTQISNQMQIKIFKDIRNWLDKGLEMVPIAINVAPVEFLRDDYAERFLRRLKEFNIPHHLVELEVTEYVLADRGSDYVQRALQLLKENGIRIALDDFGTGHSSLSRLKDYPIDCLKIDRSFIQLIEPDKEILAIIEALIQLAPKLELDIVAEGIEKSSELEILAKSGCKVGQGFLFSKAITATEVVGMLQNKIIYH